MIRNREQWGEPGSQEAMVQAELSFGYLACLLESGELEFPLDPTGGRDPYLLSHLAPVCFEDKVPYSPGWLRMQHSQG